MLVKPRLKYFMEQNQGIENFNLANAVRGWMLWQATRDKFWYFYCLQWLGVLESGETALTKTEAPGILTV